MRVVRRAGSDGRPASGRGTGHRDARLVPNPLHLALRTGAAPRRATYRALFRSHLSDAALADIRLALNQDQPLGGGRFLA
jgi:putative transposase